jgi:hypothetical protein
LFRMPRHRVYPNDPIPQLKRDAARALVPLLDDWNAHVVAHQMGTDQPRVSDIKRGKLDRFSLEALIRFLDRLGQSVELKITPRSVLSPQAVPPRPAPKK